MKDHVNKSMGNSIEMVTLIVETLTKIKPTESLRLDKHFSSEKAKLFFVYYFGIKREKLP